MKTIQEITQLIAAAVSRDPRCPQTRALGDKCVDLNFGRNERYFICVEFLALAGEEEHLWDAHRLCAGRRGSDQRGQEFMVVDPTLVEGADIDDGFNYVIGLSGEQVGKIFHFSHLNFPIRWMT